MAELNIEVSIGRYTHSDHITILPWPDHKAAGWIHYDTVAIRVAYNEPAKAEQVKKELENLAAEQDSIRANAQRQIDSMQDKIQKLLALPG